MASFGKLNASLSWNDGFDPNRYTWLTGSLAYAFNTANTLSFIAGGNLGRDGLSDFVHACRNNGSIYNVIYNVRERKLDRPAEFPYTEWCLRDQKRSAS